MFLRDFTSEMCSQARRQSQRFLLISTRVSNARLLEALFQARVVRVYDSATGKREKRKQAMQGDGNARVTSDGEICAASEIRLGAPANEKFSLRKL